MPLKSKIQELALLRNNPDVKFNSEAITKTALIDPLIRGLGWNMSDPTEFVPEYNCDGYAKDKCVDYAVLIAKKPAILIECKQVDKHLDDYYAQLEFYFKNARPARIAILTNGVEYRFYSDTKQINLLDREPLYTININHVSDSEIELLNLISKANFDAKKFIENARQLNFEYLLKKRIESELKKPSDELVTLFCKPIVSGFWKGQIETYRPFVKKYINKVEVETKPDALTPAKNLTISEKICIESLTPLLNGINLKHSTTTVYTTVWSDDSAEWAWFARILNKQSYVNIRIRIDATPAYKEYKLQSVDDLKSIETELRNSKDFSKQRYDNWHKTHDK